MRKAKCPCPVYCKYCGARRVHDPIGHRCPTRNCQWEFGFNTCTLHEIGPRPASKGKTRKNPDRPKTGF
jgi:hypothetical protein